MKLINLSSPLAPLLGKIDMFVHWLFCTKFNSQQLLFEQFFNIIGNFCNIRPKVNLFSHFNVWQYSPWSPLWYPAAKFETRSFFAYGMQSGSRFHPMHLKLYRLVPSGWECTWPYCFIQMQTIFVIDFIGAGLKMTTRIHGLVGFVRGNRAGHYWIATYIVLLWRCIKCMHFRTERWEKYELYQKMFQIKILRN